MSFELLLFRPELVECVAFVQGTVFHDPVDRVAVVNVDERVLVEDHQIRQLARLEGGRSLTLGFFQVVAVRGIATVEIRDDVRHAGFIHLFVQRGQLFFQ
jgi:hypothetical protein